MEGRRGVMCRVPLGKGLLDLFDTPGLHCLKGGKVRLPCLFRFDHLDMAYQHMEPWRDPL